jgi:cation diffusion facilitator family transporter
MSRQALRARLQRTALVSLTVTILLLVAKMMVWASTGSIAILSQALDSALDLVALGLMYVGVRVGARPADESHHYGHGKAENLAAFAQTLILGAVVLSVALDAARALGSPPSPVSAPWYAFALLGASALIDALRARYLAVAARSGSSEALSAGALNVLTDTGTALVALASLALVRLGFERADAIGGLLVAVAVGWAAVRVGKRSVDILMDRAPGAPVQVIAEAAAAAPGVSEARRVRVRRSGGQLFTDVTVTAGRTKSLERSHAIAEEVERAIERVSPGSDVVVHVEPVPEDDGVLERIQAAASRNDDVYQVHNVLVHTVEHGGRERMRVSLHAKVNPRLSLDEAHALSDDIEASIAEELGPEVRVDTHMEPLEPTMVGRDVSSERSDIVAEVRRMTLEEEDVVDCHEVLVTDTGEHVAVVAHVRGRKDLPLARLHEASERIEKRVGEKLPDVGSVLIHFEPA